MACVYCDSYKLEEKKKTLSVLAGTSQPVLHKCSLETSPDNRPKKH